MLLPGRFFIPQFSGRLHPSQGPRYRLHHSNEEENSCHAFLRNYSGQLKPENPIGSCVGTYVAKGITDKEN
jgi:hypothetical protein